MQDELCRSRKNKTLPGLTIITEMMDSQGELAPDLTPPTGRAANAWWRAGKKHLRAGQDPCLQILSIACTKKV
jgi:hypothetical protein